MEMGCPENVVRSVDKRDSSNVSLTAPKALIQLLTNSGLYHSSLHFCLLFIVETRLGLLFHLCSDVCHVQPHHT